MTKRKSNAGRKKSEDPKIEVRLFIEGSLIIGKENLPFNPKNKDHKNSLELFKQSLKP